MTTAGPTRLLTTRESTRLLCAPSRGDQAAEHDQRIYLAAPRRPDPAPRGARDADRGAGRPPRARRVAIIAARRATVKPATLSIEYRALATVLDVGGRGRRGRQSPMERMKAPTVPTIARPGGRADDFRKLLQDGEGKDFIAPP